MRKVLENYLSVWNDLRYTGENWDREFQESIRRYWEERLE